jgi:hypothetical protein
MEVTQVSQSSRLVGKYSAEHLNPSCSRQGSRWPASLVLRRKCSASLKARTWHAHNVESTALR